MANLTEANANGNQIDGDTGGTPENDNIDTSAGNLDYNIIAGGGDDVIITGDGDADLLNGHTVQGGDGNDEITGGAANDNLRGGSFNSDDPDGDDIINGGAGDDGIVGGLGNDTLNGDAGNDTIYGEGGNDTINGGTGRDFIYGGAGNDIIDGGDNPSDELGDVLFFNHSINQIESITFDNGTGTITVVGPEGTDIANNIEQLGFSDNPVFFNATGLATLILGTSGADSISATDIVPAEGDPISDLNNHYIITGAGDDVVSSGIGVDSIVVGKGNDTVDAGEGNDAILSGEGDNIIDGGAGDDTVGYNFARTQIISIKRDANGVITLIHANGTDTLSNIETFDFFTSDANGNRERDQETGQPILEKVLFNDFATTFTELDDETISGTTGDDVLDGGIGNDTINGLAGNDTITGGDGDDIIDGGEDTDTAVFDFATSATTSIQRDANGVITLVSAGGTDTLSNIESLQFTDQTLQVADLANTFANIDDETITGTSGNDVVDGGAGDDTFVLGYASSLVTAISNSSGEISITGADGTDTLSNIENLQFSDQTFAVSSLSIGTANAETLNGTAEADLIFAAGGTDTISAAAGNDTILAVAAGSNVDGGAGTDTAAFTFASTDITSAVRQIDQSVIITTSQGNTTVSHVEHLMFTDTSSTVSLNSIVTSTIPVVTPKFTSVDANGASTEVTPTVYTGPVDYLQFELLGDNGNNTVFASSQNDFLTLYDGDDAAAGGDGDDVLDGGLGSNFLSGGNGNDVFFLDGRAASTSITWSTITDFSAGDSVNIWGWVEGTSTLFRTDTSNGASGYEGVTLHYDLDNNGTIDTSLTLTGLTLSEAPTPSTQSVNGVGYLLFSA